MEKKMLMTEAVNIGHLLSEADGPNNQMSNEEITPPSS